MKWNGIKGLVNTVKEFTSEVVSEKRKIYTTPTKIKVKKDKSPSRPIGESLKSVTIKGLAGTGANIHKFANGEQAKKAINKLKDAAGFLYNGSTTENKTTQEG